MSHALGLRARRTAALVATLAAVTLGVAAPAPAQAAEPELSSSEIAARSMPGVQLVRVSWKAELVVPGPVLDNSALARLYARMQRQLETGTVDPTKEGFTQAIVDALVKDPLTYFVPDKGDLRTFDAELSGTGTGWVITPDGYMVTAAHVVKPDDEELRQGFAQTALDELANDAAQALATASAKNGNAFTDDQIIDLAKAMTVYFGKYMRLADVRTTMSAQLGTAVAGGSKTQRDAEVTVVDVGTPYPGKDVALLKVAGGSNLPTMPIGDETDLVTGDTLWVAGFPGASTFRSGFDKESETQPTVTSGPITAIKTTTEGVPVFQTQAPASGGNSGGPVLDGQGEVVGVLVAGATEGGVPVAGQEFVVTASVVKEMLAEKGVTPKESETTRTYDAALTEYYADHYKRALPLFVEVRKQYPAHPYVGKFITDTQAAIAAGKDVSPRPAWFWPLIAGGLVAALLATGLVVLAFRMRRRSAPAGAPPAQVRQQAHPGPAYAAPQYLTSAQQPHLTGQPGQPAQPSGAPAGWPQPVAPVYPPQPGQQQPHYQQPQYQQPQQYPQQYPQQAPPQPHPQQAPQQAPQQYPQPGQPQYAQPPGRPQGQQPQQQGTDQGVPTPPPPGPGQGYPYQRPPAR